MGDTVVVTVFNVCIRETVIWKVKVNSFHYPVVIKKSHVSYIIQMWKLSNVDRWQHDYELWVWIYIFHHIYETSLYFYTFFRRTKEFQNSNTMYKR